VLCICFILSAFCQSLVISLGRAVLAKEWFWWALMHSYQKEFLLICYPYGCVSLSLCVIEFGDFFWVPGPISLGLILSSFPEVPGITILSFVHYSVSHYTNVSQSVVPNSSLSTSWCAGRSYFLSVWTCNCVKWLDNRNLRWYMVIWVANQLSSRQGNYPRLSYWVQLITGSLIWRKGDKRVSAPVMRYEKDLTSHYWLWSWRRARNQGMQASTRSQKK
jgi:hypothetical protein